MMLKTIKYTKAFQKDYKRHKKSGPYKKNLDHELSVVLKLLESDSKLPIRYQDHSLVGDWADHRDCHLKPDLILIYRKPDHKTLELVRLGTHSELSL